jgi:heavy metal translocating P-type ATPase
MDTVLKSSPSEPGLQADQRLVDRGWLRIGAGAAVAAQAMVFSLAINLTEIDGWAYVVVHGILIASALGALVFLGGDLTRSAWESVCGRKISIDLLFLVTLGGAFVGSLVSTFTRTGSVYYEVVAILIVVHTAGKMLGARSRVAALRVVDETREKFEFCDMVQFDGSVRRVSVETLEAGARVRVAPGGAIAADGVIAAGSGYVQETSMTGEWRPVSRGAGDQALAGTYSIDGSFEIIAAGGARRLDAILKAVGQARLAPSRLQQQADRLMAWFLPLVVGVSLLTFAFWLAHGPWERALFNAMAVLLVACPCAMGLATPISVWGGLAQLAKIGVVARTGDFIDVLSLVDVLCIDKTGTLSAETLSIAWWKISPQLASQEAWLRAAVAAVEEGLAHPVAMALRADCCELRDKLLPPVLVTNRRIIAGQGVTAEVLRPGGGSVRIAVGEYEIGRPTGSALAREKADVDPNGHEGACNVLRYKRRGKEVYVFVDDELAASVVLEERWRGGLVETFAELRELGIETEVLSGDPLAAEVLSAAMTVRGGLIPAQKLARVEDFVGDGRTVLFVGDGLNDASAMSAAHASIALRGGAELARASAMAVFVGEDLRFLPQAICVARAARASIRVNLFFAAAYNISGMALAAAGVLHPVAAALLMLGSSVFVSVNALRPVRELKPAWR